MDVRSGACVDTGCVPGNVFASFPRDQRRSVRTFAIAAEQARRFFGAWGVCSLDGPPYDVVQCKVSAGSPPRLFADQTVVSSLIRHLATLTLVWRAEIQSQA